MANTFSSRIKEIFYGTKDWKQIEQNQTSPFPPPIGRALNAFSNGTSFNFIEDGKTVDCEFTDGTSKYLIKKSCICVIDENGDFYQYNLQAANNRGISLHISHDKDVGDVTINYQSQGFQEKSKNDASVSFATSVPCKAVVDKFKLQPFTLETLASFVKEIADASKFEDYSKDNYSSFSANATNTIGHQISARVSNEGQIYNNATFSGDMKTAVEQILKDQNYDFCKQALEVFKVIDPTLVLAHQSDKTLLGDDLSRLMSNKNIQTTLNNTLGDKE